MTLTQTTSNVAVPPTCRQLREMNRQAGISTSVSISARSGPRLTGRFVPQAIRRGKPGSEARETEDVTPRQGVGFQKDGTTGFQNLLPPGVVPSPPRVCSVPYGVMPCLDPCDTRHAERARGRGSCVSRERRATVEMWESRGLCEISKGVWTSFCDVHATGISTVGGRPAPITGAAWASSTAPQGRRATIRGAPGIWLAGPVTAREVVIMIGCAPSPLSRGAV
jgi:hypothetical protein